MRYTCDDPAFAGDFVEFSDSWSRAQVRAAWAAWAAIPSRADGISEEEVAAGEEGLLAVLRPKIVAMHLTCVDAEPLTKAADLTPERTEEMDTRLYAWFVNVWIKHLNDLAELGNALGLTLFASRDTSKEATTDALPQPTS